MQNVDLMCTIRQSLKSVRLKVPHDYDKFNNFMYDFVVIALKSDKCV